VLLRAAEITISKGFRYFVIMDDKNFQDKEIYGGIYGYKSEISYYFYNVKKYTTNIIIKCFKQKPKNDSIITYNAEILCCDLPKHYKLKTPVCCPGIPS